MTADGRTIGAPFCAPRYWVGLWDLGNRPVAFGGFGALLRPLVDEDRSEDTRDHCEPTRALIAAVGNLRVVGGRDGFWTDHWTLTLGGWRGYDLDGAPPPQVVAAVDRGYPLPTTVREAHDEYAYWAWRAYAIGMVDPLWEGTDVLAVLAAPELDLVSQVRAERVRRLLVSDAVSTSLDEIETKLCMRLFVDPSDFALDASVLRDVARLRQAAPRPAPAPVVDAAVASFVAVAHEAASRRAVRVRRRRGVQNPTVTAELRRDAEQPDHEIARRLGVSPTTVNSERWRLGLQDVVRRVSRKNARASYAMARPAARKTLQAPSPEAASPCAPRPASVTPSSRPVFDRGRRRAEVNGTTRATGGEQLGLPWEPPQER